MADETSEVEDQGVNRISEQEINEQQSRPRSATWSNLFRSNSQNQPINHTTAPSTPTKTNLVIRHSPPNSSFSLSSIASVLKRPLVPSPSILNTSFPTITPSTTSSTPTSQNISPVVATDPDPPPSVPPPPPQPQLVFESEDSQTHQNVIPFDFNLFLDQMRFPESEPITKYLRSFLKEFSKRFNPSSNGPSSTQSGIHSVNEQVRVINDFLDFISIKMREIKGGPWDPRICSDLEFDHAIEAMEKLVMNRVWHLTYTPALPIDLQPSPTDDLERDTVLLQRLKLFQWVNERHLDLQLDPHESDGFLEFAKTELLKINAYKAPRDKMICILNCCKVIFGLIRHIGVSEGGADTFVPILILVVLRARPEHLISNVQYIQRFRNPDKLQGENGYYLSSLNAAISFIERLDYSGLSNITQEEFESNVEQAISTLPRSPTRPKTDDDRSVGESTSADEERTRPKLLVGSNSLPDLTRTWFMNTVPNLAERAVSKPLNAIARIVDDLSHDQEEMNPSSSDPGPKFLRPSLQDIRRSSSPSVIMTRNGRRRGEWDQGEEDEKGLRKAEHEAKLDTLCSIFSELEREVLEVILVTHHGELSVAIDSVLEMS